MFPAFVASGFAIAGAVMMFGPALIHLMNRNRYRTVQWAAMDFLLEAMQSNRRLLRIRDLLLMLLRAAALLLFGLALARPYFSAGGNSATDNSLPPHALVVIDNSLSSTLDSLAGSPLEIAREQARHFIESLPPSSQISVIPLSGSQTQRLSDPFTSRTDAIDAVDKVSATHGSGELAHALNQARRLAEQTPTLAPYVVVFGDQQAAQWQRLARTNPPEDDLPVLIMESDAAAPDNAWVESFGISDELAEIGTETRFTARVRYQGEKPRTNVPVTFQVRGNDVETKFVDFQEGDSVQTLQFDHVFDAMEIDPARALGIPVSLQLGEDALPADDSRSLVVPLVASVPVVFIDQWSDAEESTALGRLGETWILRQLLCPRTNSGPDENHLIRPIHLSYQQADSATLQAALRDARLAVVAGIEAPSPELVTTLRQYVDQGGQLAIAAGGSFDPAAWTDIAWRDGHGILPRPLAAEPVGHSLSELVDSLQPFRISAKGLLDHAYFRLANIEEPQLIDLYTDALFFKTVAPLPATDAANTSAVNENASLSSDWLAWLPPVMQTVVSQKDSTSPNMKFSATTIAQFENGIDFVVERRFGEGKVVFFSSGVSSEWSTLPSTNAVLIFDRILRNQLASTFQRYNFNVGETALVPLPSGGGDAIVHLETPDSGMVRSLSPRFLNEETRGVLVDNLDTSGVFWISQQDASDAPTGAATESRFRIPISGNPVSWESELARLDRIKFEALQLPPQYQWQEHARVLGSSGLPASGYTWWKLLISLVIVILIVEMIVAAMPSWLVWIVDHRSPSATTAS